MEEYYRFCIVLFLAILSVCNVKAIVNGKPAEIGEFHAQLSIQQISDGDHFCGGILIDDNHAVTAAHCIVDIYGNPTNPDYMQVMGDDLSINVINASDNRQLRNVQQLWTHPDFNIWTLENDIAVLRFTEPFELNDNFYPINRIDDTPATGELCQIAGWGALYEGGYKVNELKRTDVPIIDQELCNESQGENILNGIFCAGYLSGNGGDACTGDSGGGIICDGELAGIITYRYGCAKPGSPGRYVDISYHNEFIDEILDLENGETTTSELPPSETTIPPPTTTTKTTTETVTEITEPTNPTESTEPTEENIFIM